MLVLEDQPRGRFLPTLFAGPENWFASQFVSLVEDEFGARMRPEEHLGPVGQAGRSNRPAVSPEHALRWEKQCFLELCVVAEDSGVIARDGPQDSIGQLVEFVCGRNGQRRPLR